MTCVVAVTDGERLVFGADSAATNLKTGEIYDFANEKIFRCGPWLVGHTGSFRLGQILRWQVAWPTPPDDPAALDAFITVDVVNAIRKAMRAAGVAAGRRKPEPRETILLGLRGRIFAISRDYSVAFPQHPFAAIGHGRFLAYGALQALRFSQLGIEDRCRAALEAAQLFDPTVREPFRFLTA